MHRTPRSRRGFKSDVTGAVALILGVSLLQHVCAMRPPYKTHWKTAVGLVAIVAVIGYWYFSDSRNEVFLRPNGKADFYRGGVFHRDKFELSVHNGHWVFFRPTPRPGEDYGGELAVPFECPYNEHRKLRLEDGGKAYMIDKKASTRQELKVVNGQWSYDASDHWQSIFDFD